MLDMLGWLYNFIWRKMHIIMKFQKIIFDNFFGIFFINVFGFIKYYELSKQLTIILTDSFHTKFCKRTDLSTCKYNIVFTTQKQQILFLKQEKRKIASNRFLKTGKS